MEQLRDKYRRFKAWQEKPYEVAQLSAEKHECATCGTEFHGNYCPRCVQFLWLLVLSAPLYLFFRHNPKIPDVRYSEFFVSMVYITNMMTIITIIGGFFMPGQGSIEFLAYILSIIPLKQLYGFSYIRTFFKIAGSIIILLILGIILIGLIGFLIAFYTGAID